MSKVKRPEGFPKSQPARRPEGALHTLLFSRKTTAPIVLFVIAFTLYANTISHDFALDDDIVIGKNVFVQKGIAGLVDIFSNGFLVGYTKLNDAYRPFAMATLAVEVSLVGTNPHVHHATNVVLYCFIAVALFIFLRTILKNHNPIVPFIVTLLFVVHPVHTEVVANIKSRDEILSFLFAICSLLLLLRGIGTNNVWPRVVSYLSYFLALLSKEHVIMFLLIIPLVLHFFTELKWRRVLRESLPFAAVALAYLFIRWSIVDVDAVKQTPSLINNSLVAATGIVARTPMAFNILGRYLLLLFFPLRLTYDYSYNQIPFVGWDDVWATVSMAAYVAMSVYAVYGFVHRDQRSFGVAYYLITLSLVSNLVFLTGSTMAERFLFTPSLGFCYTLCLFAAQFGRLQFSSGSSQRRSWIVAATFAICIVLGVRTITRGADWKNDLTLFTADVMSSPNSARVHSSLGWIYLGFAKNLQRGDQQTELLQKANVHYRKSLEILPAQWEPWHDLGRSYYIAGNYDEAVKDYQRALECDSNSAMVHSSLGQAYLQLGNKLQKGDQQTELFQKAIVHYRKSLEILPAQWEVWHELGYIYYLAGDYDEALKDFQRALECDPKRSRTYVNMGAIAFSRKEYGRAIEFFNTAVKLDSSNADAYGNLGAVYQQTGDYKSALFCYHRALQLNPSLESARRNLEWLNNTSVTKK